MLRANASLWNQHHPVVPTSLLSVATTLIYCPSIPYLQFLNRRPEHQQTESPSFRAPGQDHNSTAKGLNQQLVSRLAVQPVLCVSLCICVHFPILPFPTFTTISIDSCPPRAPPALIVCRNSGERARAYSSSTRIEYSSIEESSTHLCL